jgi:hypothetical protein
MIMNPTIIYVANVVIALACIAAVILGKLDWPVAAGIVTALLLPSGAQTAVQQTIKARQVKAEVEQEKKLDAMKGRYSSPLLVLVMLSALFGLVGVEDACTPSGNPDVGKIVEAGVPAISGVCTLLEGITDNQTVITICADAQELFTIGGIISSLLPKTEQVEAGIVVPCTMLIINSGVSICATKQQLGQAIPVVLAKRRAKFLLDGGK